jgi:D-alanyl-D-alanine carboxypeptidase
MNKKAKSLGMKHSTFADASGASSNNVSTLHDLLRLSTYIYNNRSFIYRISSGANVGTAYDVYEFENLKNFNKTEGLEKFVGGKVGKTNAAQETIISLYTMNINGTDRTLAFIILGTKDRQKAMLDLYAYIQKQYGTSSL